MTTKKNFPVSSQHGSSEFLLKDIRRNTKRIFSSEQKVLIVMEGIRGEQSIAELCRKYRISDSTYYKYFRREIRGSGGRERGHEINKRATHWAALCMVRKPYYYQAGLFSQGMK